MHHPDSLSQFEQHHIVLNLCKEEFRAGSLCTALSVSQICIADCVHMCITADFTNSGMEIFVILDEKWHLVCYPQGLATGTKKIHGETDNTCWRLCRKLHIRSPRYGLNCCNGICAESWDGWTDGRGDTGCTAGAWIDWVANVHFDVSEMPSRRRRRVALAPPLPHESSSNPPFSSCAGFIFPSLWKGSPGTDVWKQLEIQMTGKWALPSLLHFTQHLNTESH